MTLRPGFGSNVNFRSLARGAVGATALAVAAVAQGAGGDTELISVTAVSRIAAGDSGEPSVSADGRYVAFMSGASSSALVGGPELGSQQVYLRDRSTRTTVRASVSHDGAPPDSSSLTPDISADGRFVVFLSMATNLVPGDTNGQPDFFVWSRQSNTVERVTVNSSEVQANTGGWAYWSSISGDGRYVAYASDASNLVPGDDNGTPDIFVRDRVLGTTERVSVNSAGRQAGGSSWQPVVSANGRYVAFTSQAPDLVPGDVNGSDDVFVHDRVTGQTELVSRSGSGAQGNADSAWVALSADGRYVAFRSQASNLVGGDTNGLADAFVRDRLLGTTERVSVSSTGAQGEGSLGDTVSISDDGRYVGFQSEAANLVPGDTNGVGDSFVHDRVTGTTRRVSVDAAGSQGDDVSGTPELSADGRFAAFMSQARLASNDFNTGSNAADVYLHDREPASKYAFTLNPDGRDFGAQAVGTRRTLGFWLKNKGSTALPVLAVGLRGEDRAMFEVTHRCGTSLPAGEGCGISVTFAPTTPGEKSAALRVVAGDDEMRRRPVTGTGVQ